MRLCAVGKTEASSSGVPMGERWGGEGVEQTDGESRKSDMSMVTLSHRHAHGRAFSPRSIHLPGSATQGSRAPNQRLASDSTTKDLGREGGGDRHTGHKHECSSTESPASCQLQGCASWCRAAIPLEVTKHDLK